jgi:hypothetical protein
MPARIKRTSEEVTEENSAAIKTAVESIDNTTKDLALESGGNLETLAGKDFATETTLGSVALESGGNLELAADKSMDTVDILNQILYELKIMNLHLAVINDTNIELEDIRT